MRFTFIILFIPLMIMAQTGSVISESWSGTDVELRMAMTKTPERAAQPSRGGGNTTSLKKPGLALMMSVAVPGSGELYAESWIKGAVMLSAEVALWFGYVHYNREGDRLDEAFRKFADENWIEKDYWVAMAEVAKEKSGWEHLSAVNDENYQDFLNTEDGLRAYEKTIGSHSLHAFKDQQYYEMIGKYHQFREGWKDSDSTTAVVTPLRGQYEDMEYETDSMYKKAGICTMVILANHIVSALDAVWTVNRYNHRIQMEPGFGLLRSRDQVHPALSMKISW